MAPTFQIEILRNGILSYFPGQTIEGILHVVTQKEYKSEGLKVTFEGKAIVHWTETQTTTTGTGSNRRQTTTTLHYSSHETYFDCKIYLLGTGSSNIYIQPGQYQYPFQFTLPQGLPSSFVGAYGMVWYEIRAEMKRSWKRNFIARVPFTVNGIVDLNIEPGASQAMEARKHKNVCCLCCKSGPVGFILRLPRKGFVSGEFLQFTAELNNQSSRKVNGVNIYLIRLQSYHATQKTRTTETVMCKARGPSVEPGDSEIWTGNILRIPPLPPTRLANCRIIDIQYLIKIEMDLAGPSINLRHEIPIIIGSIPLRNTFSEIQSLQPQQPAFNQNFQEPSAPSTSPPPYATTHASQNSYFHQNYPDLPPPTYAEATMQDQFNAGSINLSFTNDGNTGSPSAPPEEAIGFAPKYITYGWQS